jgi:hypothetical protein
MPSFRNSLLLCTTPMLLAHGALAQSPSCELLKQSLASRIPPEIRGYAMDDVPARTPVPPGGKVIGTCEGGARKVIYRRFGGPPLSGEGGTAAAPAAVASAAPTPAPAPTAAPTPAPKPPPPPAPAPASVAPAAAPKPKVEPVAPAKPVAPPAASAPVAAGPKPAPASAPAPLFMGPVLPPVVEKAPEPPAVLAAPQAPADDAGRGFFSTYGRWLWLLLALPLAGLGWAWVSHRMAYDSAGLPRGPRL